MHSMLHTTPHTYSDFSPPRSDSTLACVREGARTGSFFQHTLGFIRAIAGQKLHLQFICAIAPFTITHDSCVMSTICQSPRACRDDFQQLLPSKMDRRRLFKPTWNEPSICWNKVSARSHKQKKGNTNIQLSIAFIWLMTGCNLTPAKNSWSITNPNFIVNCHEFHQVLTASLSRWSGEQ